jgi:hypothetical protein
MSVHRLSQKGISGSQALIAAKAALNISSKRMPSHMKREITGLIRDYASGKMSAGAYQTYNLSSSREARSFLSALKKQLQAKGIPVTLRGNTLMAGNMKLVASGRSIKIVATKPLAKAAPVISITRMTKGAAKRLLRRAYEKMRPAPKKPKIVTPAYRASKAKHEAALRRFYAKYERHLMALSDGLKAGLAAVQQNPESAVWRGRISTFLESYAHYLDQNDRKEPIPTGTGNVSFPSLSLSIETGRKFRTAFKKAAGTSKPIGILVELKGFNKPLLSVRMDIKRKGKVRIKA